MSLAGSVVPATVRKIGSFPGLSELSPCTVSEPSAELVSAEPGPSVLVDF